MNKEKLKEKLQELGFEFVTPEMVSDWRNEYHDDYFAENKWVKPIDGGRRGQQYYLLWSEDNPTQLTIDSTKPVGDGCEAVLPVDLIVELAPFLGVRTTDEAIIDAGNLCVDQLRDLSSGGDHLDCITEWFQLTGQGGY